MSWIFHGYTSWILHGYFLNNSPIFLRYSDIYQIFLGYFLGMSWVCLGDKQVLSLGSFPCLLESPVRTESVWRRPCPGKALHPSVSGAHGGEKTGEASRLTGRSSLMGWICVPLKAQSIAPAAALGRVALLGEILECGSVPVLSGCGMWGVGFGRWCSMGVRFGNSSCNMRYITAA